MSIDNNNYIKIKIPGTTSNFGSGYDILGMSLGIWNEIKLKKNNLTEIKITGEGKGLLPENKNNLVLFLCLLNCFPKTLNQDLR